MLVNSRSLNTRTADNLLNILFVVENIDICCITETWLKPGDQAILADIKLRGYEIISSPRAKYVESIATMGYILIWVLIFLVRSCSYCDFLSRCIVQYIYQWFLPSNIVMAIAKRRLTESFWVIYFNTSPKFFQFTIS